MPDEKPKASLATLRDAREKAIAELSEAFAHDLIEVDEFERRLTLAHRAGSLAKIAEIVADLGASATSVALVPAAAPVARVGDHASDSVTAVFGGVERHGAWTVPAHLQAVAIMGGMSLDFREAVFPPGVTEVHVVALMGGIQLIVPPGLSVEVSGTAVMGGFGHVERTSVEADPERPLLRVHGLAILGGVAVETRLPGESEMDAHRRRTRGRRELGSSGAAKRLPAKTGR
jgi:Cell wall-active antibiotics response 4TMS YvqF